MAQAHRPPNIYGSQQQELIADRSSVSGYAKAAHTVYV
jgi:hypothetical protein